MPRTYRTFIPARFDSGSLEVLDALCAKLRLSRSALLRTRIPPWFDARAPPSPSRAPPGMTRLRRRA